MRIAEFFRRQGRFFLSGLTLKEVVFNRDSSPLSSV